MAKKKQDVKSLEEVVAQHKSAAVRLDALKEKRNAFLKKHEAVFAAERELSDQIHELAREVSDTRDEINARIEAARVA